MTSPNRAVEIIDTDLDHMLKRPGMIDDLDLAIAELLWLASNGDWISEFNDQQKIKGEIAKQIKALKTRRKKLPMFDGT